MRKFSRIGGAPSLAQQALQEAATTHAQQELERQRRVKAAARSAQFQRNRAAYEVEARLANEEDVPPPEDLGWLDDGGSYGGRAGTGGGSGGASSSNTRGMRGAGSSTGGQRPPGGQHGQRQLLFEQRFRDQTKAGVQVRAVLAEQLAQWTREDLALQLDAVQQRVNKASQVLMGTGTHPDCTSGHATITSWRSVFVRTLYGGGAVQIPTFRFVHNNASLDLHLHRNISSKICQLDALALITVPTLFNLPQVWLWRL